MKQFFFILKVLIILTLMPSAVAFSDNDNKNHLFKSNFRVNNYGAKQGLSQSVIRFMAQDDLGYLWIGTASGLNRFDGLNFTVFNHDPNDKYSLPFQFIESLYYDHHQKLWISSVNSLGYYDMVQQKFFQLENIFPKDLPIVDVKIINTRGNLIWLKTEKNLFLFNTVTMKLQMINYSDGRSKSIISVASDTELGTTWVLVSDGLLIFNLDDIEDNKVQHVEFYPHDVTGCKYMTFIDQIVWLACHNKALKYYTKTHQFDWEIIADNTNLIKDGQITSDDERYWYSSNRGVWVRDKSSDQWLNFTANPLLENALQTNKIMKVFVDAQSLVWIGTFGAGLSMWDPKSQYVHYFLNPFQLSEYDKDPLFWKADVTDLSFDQNENLWVATRGSGTYKLDADGNILQHISTEKIPGFDSEEVIGLLVDSKKRLWLSSDNWRLFVKEQGKAWRKMKFRLPKQKDNLNNNLVVRVLEDSEGRMLASTDGGLFLYDQTKNIFISLMDVFPKELKLISTRVSKVIEASDGYYWVATDAGVVVLDHDFHFFAWFNSTKTRLRLSSHEANDIVEDKFGNIWVAMVSSIVRISYINQKWVIKNYNNIALLKSQTFYTIVADPRGMIWIGGDRGLYQLDPTSDEVNIIPQKYGLQGAEFNTGTGAVDKQGRLYFGGINGLNVIDPEKLKISYPASSIVNSEFIVDGKKIHKTDAIKPVSFYDDSKFIQLKFDVVDLVNAENIELRMRIPELSDKWSPWTAERFFNLYDLSAGIYHVELESRVSGKKNKLNSTQISFLVKSSTTLLDYLIWFLSIALAGAILLFIRWRYRKSVDKTLLLINEQNRLSQEVEGCKQQILECEIEKGRLLDELSTTFKDKDLLEQQIHDLHLVDKQTGLHTRDFLKYSIDNAIRQFSSMVPTSARDETLSGKNLPQLQFLIIKLDNFEKLRLHGGLFLLNQIIIQVAAEMKNIGSIADELVRWNQDSFLFYTRFDDQQPLDLLCEKLCNVLREHEFGPSSSELRALTCSIAAIKFPFVETEIREVDWPQLIELTESAANWLSERDGDGWLIISSRQKHNNRVFVEQGIANFGDVYQKGLFDIKTAVSQSDN